MMEGSATSAMSALRGQIEERLLQTEDYRALKALDKAIAEVKAPLYRRAGASASHGTEESADQHAQLQQKIAERFNSAAA